MGTYPCGGLPARHPRFAPYSSELNPIEQVWSWLRQHCLSKKYFHTMKKSLMRFQRLGITLFQYLSG
ncbi:transposase [Pseudoalteromonas 'SMAR']|uniref:transposase n=1 Tax=Pseudoalteromonas 'SMAR' TaxID=3416908 RepID=UPI003AF2F948